MNIFFLCESLSPYDAIPSWGETPSQSASELGNWTIRGSGSSINKDQIILTPSVNSSDRFIYGEMCQRLPMYSQDFTFTANISQTEGDGSSFRFFYSKDLCSENLINFEGVVIWTNSSIKNGKKSAVYVFNRFNNSQTQIPTEPSCYWDFYNKQTNVSLSKKGSFFTVTLSDSENKEICYSNPIILPEFGYFSIVAFNPQEKDLIPSKSSVNCVKVFLDGKFKAPHDDTILVKNRKLLDRLYTLYKENIELRRSKMPFLRHYTEKKKNSNEILDGTPDDLENGLLLLSETMERAKHFAPLYFYLQLYNYTIPMLVKKPLEIIRGASYVIESINQELQEIQEITSSELNDISKDIMNSMSELKKNSFAFTRSLVENQTASHIIVRKILKDFPQNKDDSNVPIILLIICGVEFLGYIGFFFYKKSQTDNFKKVD